MSTIITDNPYTFTVADNMNINAVFENAGAIIKPLNTTYLKGGGSTGYTISITITLKNSSNSQIGQAKIDYSGGGSSTITSDTISNKTVLSGYQLVISSDLGYYYPQLRTISLYLRDGGYTGTSLWTITSPKKYDTSYPPAKLSGTYTFSESDMGKNLYITTQSNS